MRPLEGISFGFPVDLPSQSAERLPTLATDLYVWKRLRRGLRLTRNETEAIVRTSCAGFSTNAAAVMIAAQSDDPVLTTIRSEALERSQVAPVFEYLTIDIGPLLTDSPAHNRAAEWVRDRLSSYGVENAHLEPWSFGRGWTVEKLTLEMIEPRYLPLIGYADGWSAAISGQIEATPVFVGGMSPEELAAQLKGAIVMPEPILTNFVRNDRPNPSGAGDKTDVAAATRVASRRPPPLTETPQNARCAPRSCGFRGIDARWFSSRPAGRRSAPSPPSARAEWSRCWPARSPPTARRCSPWTRMIPGTSSRSRSMTARRRR